MVKSDRSFTIAHDYFTQKGGAERVALALIEELDPIRVVSALGNPVETFELPGRIEYSFLHRIARFRRSFKEALPLYPLAWWSLPKANSAVLLCSSSGWSHAMRCTSGTLKVVYCHNPARWLYQPQDFFKDQPGLLRLLMAFARPALVRWDRRAAQSADLYLCNSHAVAERIYEHYGIEAMVVPPPVAFVADGIQSRPAGVPATFFLTVSRGRGYKNTKSLIDAFKRMPDLSLVVVGGASLEAPANVQFLGRVPEAELRWLYGHARALISVAHEDFGLTPIEANSLGTPALVLRAGGFLDSLADGVSGRYISNSTPPVIIDAVRHFDEVWDRDAVAEHAQRYSRVMFIHQVLEAIGRVIEDR